eukprot:GHVP01019220.1.p1 GENE.GHVP01019220.1~~GHVP01019220.1.p1  ORF type:complete len:460 (+),score=50.15 GHVP01019220.1:32-1411(+)
MGNNPTPPAKFSNLVRCPYNLALESIEMRLHKKQHFEYIYGYCQPKSKSSTPTLTPHSRSTGLCSPNNAADPMDLSLQFDYTNLSPAFHQPSTPSYSSSPRKGSHSSRLRDRNTIKLDKYNFFIYGTESNHFPFLSPRAVDIFVSFIVGTPTLNIAMSICPHWFMSISNCIQSQTRHIVDNLRAASQDYLEIDDSTLSVQPLFTADTSVRTDLLIFARVLPKAANSCLDLRYSCSYPEAPETRAGQRRSGNSGTARKFINAFRFDVFKQGTSRAIWLHRDVCRFHGDELMIASVADVASVCVGDRVEIPVNIGNAFGNVILESVHWESFIVGYLPSRRQAEADPFRQCVIERMKAHWEPIDTFLHLTPETRVVSDFKPQWKLKNTRFTGVEITHTRSEYDACQTGEVPESFSLLGIACFVRPQNSSIVVPLKRLGLQHDRFTQLYTRCILQSKHGKMCT